MKFFSPEDFEQVLKAIKSLDGKKARTKEDE